MTGEGLSMLTLSFKVGPICIRPSCKLKQRVETNRTVSIQGHVLPLFHFSCIISTCASRVVVLSRRIWYLLPQEPTMLEIYAQESKLITHNPYPAGLAPLSGPSCTNQAASNTAIVEQKLLLLSFCGTTLAPSTLTILVAALVLNPQSKTFSLQEISTMFSWQFSPLRHSCP